MSYPRWLTLYAVFVALFAACSGAQEPAADALLVAARPYCIAAAAAEGFDPKLCELPEKLRPFVEEALRQRLAGRAGSRAAAPCSEPVPVPEAGTGGSKP